VQRAGCAGRAHRAAIVPQGNKAAVIVRQHNGGDESVPTVQVVDKLRSNPPRADICRAIGL
jgi:hypothetical protein